jgi:hypothetical protein
MSTMHRRPADKASMPKGLLCPRMADAPSTRPRPNSVIGTSSPLGAWRVPTTVPTLITARAEAVSPWILMTSDLRNARSRIAPDNRGPEAALALCRRQLPRVAHHWQPLRWTSAGDGSGVPVREELGVLGFKASG